MKQIKAKSSPTVSSGAVEEQSDESMEGKQRLTGGKGKGKGKGKSQKIGEVAGGTAAGCAAICCCCPCGVINLLVLAMYKMPAGICRKMWRKRKRRQMTKKKNELLLLQQQEGGAVAGSTTSSSSHYDDSAEKMVEGSRMNAVELDNQMWTQFYGTGFWRSTSQKDA